MLRTYKAVLRGDRIEWIDSPPERANPTPVHITVLEDTSSSQERGRVMAQALETLAAMGTLAGIEDPGSWQREIRSDRTLPGREP